MFFFFFLEIRTLSLIAPLLSGAQAIYGNSCEQRMPTQAIAHLLKPSAAHSSS